MFDGKVPISKSYVSNRRGGDKSSRDRGNFVEKARTDREARAQEKLRQRSATAIQARVRSRGSRRAASIALKNDFDLSMQNITKMSSILSAAGKKFIVPPPVMLRLLRIVSMAFNVKDTGDLHRLNDMFSLAVDYVTFEDSKIELSKADLQLPWIHLFGKLFSFAFAAITQSIEQQQLEQIEQKDKELKQSIVAYNAARLVKIIPEISNELSSPVGSAFHALPCMATIFIQEECRCLTYCMKNGYNDLVSMLIPSISNVLLRLLPVSQSVEGLTPPSSGIWTAVMTSVLSLPDLCGLPFSGDILGVLDAHNFKGWRFCLEMLSSSAHTASFPICSKKNIVANYFVDIQRNPSSAELYVPLLLGTHTNSLLRLLSQILEPGVDTDSRVSSSTKSITNTLTSKHFVVYAFREALECSSASVATGILSLYGRLLFCFPNDEQGIQAILGSRFHYQGLNLNLWRYLSDIMSLNVSSERDEVLCSRLSSGDGGSHTTLMFILLLFCRSLWHELFTMDDEDFLRSECVIGRSQIEVMINLINKLLLRLYRLEIAADMASGSCNVTTINSGASGSVSTHTDLRRELREHATRLYNQVYKIDDRRNFLGDSTIWQWKTNLEQYLVLDNRGIENQAGQTSHFAGMTGDGTAMDLEEDEADDLDMRIDSGEGETSTSKGAKQSPLRNHITCRALLAHPQVLAFSRRVAFFQDLLDEDKAERTHEDRSMEAWMGRQIDIDRNDIVSCAYREINRLNSTDLKGRLKVQFISKQGYTEAGIDGGGLFKEFMDDLVSNLFSEEFGLFKVTEEQLLVPNPAALDAERLELFRFSGKMLGKALYESLLVDPQFSGVFLNVLLGRSNHFDDLGLLDEQLYGNLKQLKHMSAESLAALGLTFEAQRSGDGRITTHELVPGGSEISVTADNVTEYIHRFAHFKLNLEFQLASKHFNAGLHELIPEDWIRLFSPRELQQLISGQKKGIDIEDMKRHVVYAGGYAESQPYVQEFWRIVAEMDLQQQGDLLKFITSCSRQPLRGFSQLAHRMCIQRVPQYSQEQFDTLTSSVITARLPSAATCVNLLKLPEYDNPDTLKEKLLYAISHNTGFELS